MTRIRSIREIRVIRGSVFAEAGLTRPLLPAGVYLTSMDFHHSPSLAFDRHHHFEDFHVIAFDSE